MSRASVPTVSVRWDRHKTLSPVAASVPRSLCALRENSSISDPAAAGATKHPLVQVPKCSIYSPATANVLSRSHAQTLIVLGAAALHLPLLHLLPHPLLPLAHPCLLVPPVPQLLPLPAPLLHLPPHLLPAPLLHLLPHPLLHHLPRPLPLPVL